MSNLPFTLTNESLLSAFSEVGPVKSAFVVQDHESKESKGVGYVTYAMREDAVAASTEMNNKLLAQGSDKRKCRVEWARQRATLKERKEQAKDNELSNVLGQKKVSRSCLVTWFEWLLIPLISATYHQSCYF